MDHTCIIGDIHGCQKTFLSLLSKLPKSIKNIYTVGDMIDRGPNSKEVIQTCMDRGIKSVKGNHEDMFIDYLTDGFEYERGMYEINGGNATLRSYGTYKDVYDKHLEFIINLPYYIETDDFILTHAGVSISHETTFRDLSRRSKDAVLWNRGWWSTNLSKIQIFGHTIHNHVKRRKKPNEDKLAWADIDTGCFKGGWLTAFLFPSLEVIQVRNTEDEWKT